MRGAQLLDCLTAIGPADAEERAVARRVKVRVSLASMVSVFVLISRKEKSRVSVCQRGWVRVDSGGVGWRENKKKKKKTEKGKGKG
jgi:hypothetical protein